MGSALGKTAGSPGDATAFDANGDGWVDLLLSRRVDPSGHPVSGTWLLYNNRDGTWTDTQIASQTACSTDAGDLDGDGHTDLHGGVRSRRRRLVDAGGADARARVRWLKAGREPGYGAVLARRNPQVPSTAGSHQFRWATVA